MILIALIAGAGLIAGCAEPLSVTIASNSFDGFSYATGGNSVSDLAISQAADRDCALMRALKDDPVCRDYTLQERRDMAVARVESDREDRRANRVSDPDLYAPAKAPSPLLVAQAAEAQAKLDESLAKAENPGGGNAREAEAGSRKRPRSNDALASASLRPAAFANASNASRSSVDDRSYLVLGSFASRANAESARGRYAGESTTVATTNVNGRAIHRVISGPYPPGELNRARIRLAQAYGVRNAWTLPACTSGIDASCVATSYPKTHPAASAVQVAAIPTPQ